MHATNDQLIQHPATEAALLRVAEIADCLRLASGSYTPTVASNGVPWAGSVQPGKNDLGQTTVCVLIEVHMPLMHGPSFDGDIDAIRSRLDTWLWKAREIAAGKFRDRVQQATLEAKIRQEIETEQQPDRTPTAEPMAMERHG